MWLYLAIQSGAVGSRVLPLKLRYRISTVIADFLWLIWTSKRRTCIDNMAVVLGGSPTDKEVRRVARRAFHQFGRAIVDFLGFSNIDPEDPLLTQMPVSGWDHVAAALDRGKGVILATGHFGSIDMGGVALAKRTGNFYAVADTFRPAYVNRLIKSTREQKGFRLIPTTSAREIIRALHKNAVVVVLFDRPMPVGQGTPVSFFGRETALPAGIAMMARHTRATVIPAFLFREHDNSFRAEAFPPVTEGLSGDRERDVRTVMQRLADSLERAIREEPAQWYMFRAMWPGLTDVRTTREMHEAPA